MTPHMSNRHLGKRDFVEDSRDLLWADIKPKGVAVPTVPKPRGGFGMDFSNWGMHGNGPQDDNAYPEDWAAAEGAGDCTIADPCNATMEEAKNAGRPIPQFGTKCAIGQYSVLTAKTQGAAYDPQTGANDNGLEPRDVLLYRQNPGLADNQGNRYKIGPFVRLQPGSLQELWDILWFTEHVTIGVQLQQIQMDEFNAGQQLTYDASSATIGGHDEVIVGHPVNSVWTGVMWALRYTMTPQVITETCDEAWGYFDPEDISTVTGKNYEGYDPAQLEEYLTLLGQQFPQS